MKRWRWGQVVAIAGGCWLAVAQAQAPQEERVGPAGPPASARATAPRPMFAAESAATAHPLEPHERDERRFLKEAAAASRFQVDAARLALARSTSQSVRSFAASMSAEHQAAANDVLRLLHRRGLAPPMLENTQRRTLTRLARLQGVKFEREYVATVIAAAQAEATLCEKANSAVQDPALAGWIARTLPALRTQVEHAQRVAAGWQPARPGPRHGRPNQRVE